MPPEPLRLAREAATGVVTLAVATAATAGAGAGTEIAVGETEEGETAGETAGETVGETAGETAGEMGMVTKGAGPTRMTNGANLVAAPAESGAGVETGVAAEASIEEGTEGALATEAGIEGEDSPEATRPLQRSGPLICA
ncbi:hypothetical protein B484DRAFT_403431 [Ochromonadaceae sp. CCMP2298]|nr:hypothetical protein B484DRAFT_403431 [Ochromonadaceae sp. CCMP2298]